jgi:16S rRNA (adenine(1408)-N(1))-methyltransferase
VRLVEGRKLREVGRAELSDWLAEQGGRLHVDLGTGDGRYAYELAKASPSLAVLGLDPELAGLAEYSGRALRKPARGGLANVRYGLGSIEALPSELAGLASGVSIILPWGSLLRAVALPEPGLLANLRAICAPGARLTVVFTYDRDLDPGQVARLDLPPLGEDVAARLAPGYAEAGWRIEGAVAIGNAELRGLASTWARRLGHGERERVVWRVEGLATGDGGQ